MRFSESGDFVLGLDRWIEGDINRGSGNAKPCVLHCLGCDWTGPFNDAVVAHYAATGHDLTYRGIVQDIANLVKR